jgi:FlaA1/EpsC-like NDP-sugar epimerase
MSHDDRTLELLGRSAYLFDQDVTRHSDELSWIVRKSRFLIVGGAGCIGQAVTKEIMRRDPATLHVVDISENNMVELVRDVRSTVGCSSEDFRTFAIDCGSLEFRSMVGSQGPYDYVLNLSALKHVRSERDPYTLMRMVDVNIFNAVKVAEVARAVKAQNYFCVSTDKAAEPVNMMGASKRIMEQFLLRASKLQSVSMARFANVAFSDGSLLHGFTMRFEKRQPISAPHDVRRYFMTPREAGELCLLASVLGNNRDLFFPKLKANLNLLTFSEIAERFLHAKGFRTFKCSSEQEARDRAHELISTGRWPCYFFASDTTGEKPVEEFFTKDESVDVSRFSGIGVVKYSEDIDFDMLEQFERGIQALKRGASWTKEEIVAIFRTTLTDFSHVETGRNLDQKM